MINAYACRHTNAHIRPETAFALANQSREEIEIQYEIDMANANPNANLANATIFHLLPLGELVRGKLQADLD